MIGNPALRSTSARLLAIAQTSSCSLDHPCCACGSVRQGQVLQPNKRADASAPWHGRLGCNLLARFNTPPVGVMPAIKSFSTTPTASCFLRPSHMSSLDTAGSVMPIALMAKRYHLLVETLSARSFHRHAPAKRHIHPELQSPPQTGTSFVSSARLTDVGLQDLLPEVLISWRKGFALYSRTRIPLQRGFSWTGNAT